MALGNQNSTSDLAGIEKHAGNCNFNMAEGEGNLSQQNMVQYHDTIRMVNFINPTSTIGIVVDLYPLYSTSLPVVRVVRYAGYGS